MEEVEEDIDDIQEDVEDIQEDIDAIEEDVKELEEGFDTNSTPQTAQALKNIGKKLNKLKVGLTPKN